MGFRTEYYYRAETIENSTGYMLYFVKHVFPDGSEDIASGYYYTPQDADNEVDRLNDELFKDNK